MSLFNYLIIAVIHVLLMAVDLLIFFWLMQWLSGRSQNRWIQNFAYRTHIQIWFFAVAPSMAALIALFTISYQSIKAATANPVDSLRYE